MERGIHEVGNCTIGTEYISNGIAKVINVTVRLSFVSETHFPAPCLALGEDKGVGIQGTGSSMETTDSELNISATVCPIELNMNSLSLKLYITSSESSIAVAFH